MILKSLFRKVFSLLFLIALFYVIDSQLYLSWNYWWFDKVMHFSAGIDVAMAVVLVCIYFKKYLTRKIKIMAAALFGVFIIGVLWECYELYFGLTAISDGALYVKDTVIDLILDMLGGYIGARYALRYVNKMHGQ